MYWPDGKVRAGHARLFIQSMIVRRSRRTSFPASAGNNILRISDKYFSGATVRDIRPQTKTPRNGVSVSPGNWCYRRCELTASVEGLHLLVRVRHITRPACPKQQHFVRHRPVRSWHTDRPGPSSFKLALSRQKGVDLIERLFTFSVNSLTVVGSDSLVAPGWRASSDRSSEGNRQSADAGPRTGRC